MDTDTLLFPRGDEQPPDSGSGAGAAPVPAPPPTATENGVAPEAAPQHEDAAPPATDAPAPPDPVAVAGVPAAPVATPTPEAALSPLEERVRRLEAAVAELQGLRNLRPAEPPGPVPPWSAARPPLPTAILVDPGRRAAPTIPGPSPLPARPATAAGPGRAGRRRTWLLFESLSEARAIVRMYFDPRYHLPWSARILPLVLLAAILVSSWLPFMGIPLVGGLLNKVVDLVLAFFLFKALGHEARRYRETAPDLPPNLRL